MKAKLVFPGAAFPLLADTARPFDVSPLIERFGCAGPGGRRSAVHRPLRRIV